MRETPRMERKLVFTPKDVVRLRVTSRACGVASVWTIPPKAKPRGNEAQVAPTVPNNCPHCEQVWSEGSENPPDALHKALAVFENRSESTHYQVALEVDAEED